MIYQSRRMRILNSTWMGEGGIRAVMLRRYDAGKNYEEIAREFNLPVSTAGYYMKRFLADRQLKRTEEVTSDANTCPV